MDPHIAWLAGIYEGEGNINTSIGLRPDTHLSVSRVIRLTIAQKDPWLLYKARDILIECLDIPEDAIKINERRSSNRNNAIYRLDLFRFDHVDRTMAAIWPWLSLRRKEQAVDALVRYADAAVSQHGRVKEVDSELTYERIMDTFPSILTKEG